MNDDVGSSDYSNIVHSSSSFCTSPVFSADVWCDPIRTKRTERTKMMELCTLPEIKEFQGYV